MINASIAGLTLTNIDKTVSGNQLVQSLTTLYNPNTLIIVLGTNDLAQDIDTVSFQKEYKELINLLQERKFTGAIILLGLFNRTDYPGKRIQEYSSSIEKIASLYNNVWFINPYGWLGKDDLVDTVHPKKEVQEKIANNLLKEITSNIKFVN